MTTITRSAATAFGTLFDGLASALERAEQVHGGAPHPLWDASRAERIAACEHDLVLFLQVYCPGRTTDATPDFHRELAALVEDNETQAAGRLALAAPRGHAKSTLLSFAYPLRAILYRKKRFVLVVSDTATQAITLTDDIRKELEDNPRIRADFGDLVGKGKWTATWFITSSDISVMARGTGSRVRGFRHREARPDLIIGDDLENMELVATPEQRAKTWEWWTKEIVPMVDPHRGTVLVVGTVLHADSLLMKILALTTIYATRVYRALRDDGTPLWAARYSLATLARIKDEIGSLAFNCEYMNTPIDDTTQIFKPAWWAWYQRTDVVFDRARQQWYFRGRPLRIYQGVDPAISEDPNADLFAHVTVGVAAPLTPGEEPDVIVLEPYEARIDFPTQVETIVRRFKRWTHTLLVGIETVAYQRALKQQVMRDGVTAVHDFLRTPDEREDVRQHYAGLPEEIRRKVRTQKKSRTTKHMRILSRSALVEGRHVYLRAAGDDEEGEAIPELGGRRVHHTQARFFKQATLYPRSDHDDLLDAFDNALACAEVRSRWGKDWF